MELIRLDRGWELALREFLLSLTRGGDDAFFQPHAADVEAIRKIIADRRKDEYLLLVDGGEVYGYGLLRGWDEGYEIPSLGLAIHASVRGAGFGRAFMHYLHATAKHRGAKKIRLRVHKNNAQAIRLYRSLGYALEQDGDQPTYLIGFKSLAKAGVS
ncbi:MAG: GNAT family N-acetyltransferase [Burkholderiales bacterium]|nr:GNAT family N-acetyltransferase [Burkholderiales bacterium]